MHAILWPVYQFNLCKLPTLVGSIVVVGGLTCCALLHLVCNLKATQMNIQKLILFDFELIHSAMKSTKNKIPISNECPEYDTKLHLMRRRLISTYFVRGLVYD